MFELAYRHLREDGEHPLSTLLAPIVLVSLAPFLGVQTASDFVCRQVAHEQAPLAGAA